MLVFRLYFTNAGVLIQDLYHGMKSFLFGASLRVCVSVPHFYSDMHDLKHCREGFFVFVLRWLMLFSVYGHRV